MGLIEECEEQGLGEVGLVMVGKHGVSCSRNKSCSNRGWWLLWWEESSFGGGGGGGDGERPFGW